MPRHILPADSVHPAIRDRVNNWHRKTVEEVIAAVSTNNVVVVGMKQNPHPKKARAALDAASVPHRYLEYGSYLPGAWHQRLALKMWSGWPTFPMCFVGGRLVGGADELLALLEAGELK